MATARETNIVYGAGVAQGIVLVTFPAASTIFTSPDEYGLSNTQYGFLFVPQVVTAIAASLLGARLGRRFGTKRVGGIIEIIFGINAEGKSLETVTKPLTSTGEPGSDATRVPASGSA